MFWLILINSFIQRSICIIWVSKCLLDAMLLKVTIILFLLLKVKHQFSDGLFWWLPRRVLNYFSVREQVGFVFWPIDFGTFWEAPYTLKGWEWSADLGQPTNTLQCKHDFIYYYFTKGKKSMYISTRCGKGHPCLTTSPTCIRKAKKQAIST